MLRGGESLTSCIIRRFANVLPGWGPTDNRSAESTRAMTPADVDDRIRTLVEPFNKKGIAIEDATTFAGDFEFDSLTVMDFVAAIEDEFDIIISMNQQAEIENWGQLVAAVHKLHDS
jgi:acyl carrier protein